MNRDNARAERAARRDFPALREFLLRGAGRGDRDDIRHPSQA